MYTTPKKYTKKHPKNQTIPKKHPFAPLLSASARGFSAAGALLAAEPPRRISALRGGCAGANAAGEVMGGEVGRSFFVLFCLVYLFFTEFFSGF